MVDLVLAGFNTAGLGGAYEFGLDGWRAALAAPGTLGALATSFLLSLRVLAGFAIALFISWSIVRLAIPGRRFIEISLWFAFFLPMVPIALSWTLLLHPNYGYLNQAIALIPFAPKQLFSINSIGGIMWVYLTIGTVPFLTIIFAPVFRQVDATFEEAGRVSGAGRLQTTFRVTLPLVLPALMVGLIATYVRSLESFEVEQILGTPARIFVFTTRIYDLVRDEPPHYPPAMALASLFLALILAMAALQLFLVRRRAPSATMRSQGFRGRMMASRRLRMAISAVVIFYIVIAIYLPVAVLLAGSCNRIFGFLQMQNPWTFVHWQEVFADGRFLRAARNSLLFGVGIAALVMPLYLRLAWITARNSDRWQGAVSLLLWLPWAVPSFLFGLAMMDLLLRVDALTVFYGTAVPIVLAFLIKEMPIGVQLLKAAIEQSGRELIDAARVAGASRIRAFWRVGLPLLSPTLVAVAIIVFAAVVREISTIVMIAAPGTETLALLMFDFANTGRTESAAVIGVILATVSMILAVITNRRIVPPSP